MKISKTIPSIITSLNLICGAVSSFLALEGNIKCAIYLILLAAIFDFFDGFAARMLNATSELGKQLDSLADLISFGFAPTAILYYHIKTNSIFPDEWAYLTILILVFSALRLAIFNIDTEQTIEFRGLPTPASALFIISIVFPPTGGILNITHIIDNPITMIIIILALSTLMVSRIRLMSLKMKNFKIKDNVWIIILLLLSLISILLFGILGISFSIIIYILLSLIKQTITKNKNRQNEIYSKN